MVVALFWPGYIGTTLVYMLQSTEYQPKTYLKWFWRTNDFAGVMYRRELDATRAARFLQIFVKAGMAGQMLVGLAAFYGGIKSKEAGLPWFGVALLLSAPLVWAHILALVAWLGRLVITGSREKQYAATATHIFHKHEGIRIAIAGSYGKTSMKELLQTVLSQGMAVAATPGNMNVVSSHARFARLLDGSEDVVIVELGEGKPGDVARFTDILQPHYGIITGLAPAHLDAYKTLAAAGEDIFSIGSFVQSDHIFVNADSVEAKPFMPKGSRTYSTKSALGWRVGRVTTGLKGTSFVMSKGKRQLSIHSGLIGSHQAGPLALVAAFALELGLTEKQVVSGMDQTKPYQHRLEPYQLNGAWIIDDTYNGNLEGIAVGTALLKALPANRKIYVTPGLVDQGKDTDEIHRQVGIHIAQAQPDLVVLMQNSVCAAIQLGLRDGGYRGQLSIEKYPLEFYQGLADFVASGDVALLQNDWPDNYA